MRFVPGLLALLVCGCVNIPDVYAPPQQRKPLSVEDSSPLKSFINMNEVAAPVHFVRDIAPAVEGGSWRWARKSPTLMFSVPSTKHMKFSADFTISGHTLKETGPVTMTITINGHELDKTTYSTEGDRHFEKPVPEDWLRTKAENVVTMEVDKVYVAPSDKVVLGFVLTRAGFIQQ